MVATAILTLSPDRRKALLDAVFADTARGWSIVAVTGKRAAGRWKPYQKRRPEERTVRRMFARPRITGMAVVTGAVSGGLAIRDFDQAKAYDRWAESHPEDAARLPTVRTSRGFHLFGRLEEESYETFDDGELRDDSGHYVVLPPSLHPDGIVYEWKIPIEGELPLLPSSLAHSYSNQSDAEDPRRSSRPSISIAWWTSAVASTLPRGPGQRNRCIFHLARALKSIRPNATAEELRPVVREWHRLALPVIRTKGFGETWSDFVIAWGRIRRPAGPSFAAAVTAAEITIPPAIVGQNGYDGHLARLVALCFQLAQLWEERPFPLGCKIAAKHLGVSTRHAGRLLKTLEFDGVLKLATKESKRDGRAREWRLIATGGREE
jgi:hypothetical protein